MTPAGLDRSCELTAVLSTEAKCRGKASLRVGLRRLLRLNSRATIAAAISAPATAHAIPMPAAAPGLIEFASEFRRAVASLGVWDEEPGFVMASPVGVEVEDLDDELMGKVFLLGELAVGGLVDVGVGKLVDGDEVPARFFSPAPLTDGVTGTKGTETVGGIIISWPSTVTESGPWSFAV